MVTPVELELETPAALDTSIFDAVIADGSVDRRLMLAEQLCGLLADPEAPTAEKRCVLPAVLKLTCDPEIAVRTAVARHLAPAAEIDAEAVFSIAADDDTVALPFLAGCVGLAASSLLAVLRVGDPARQAAIAGRADLTADAVRLVVHQGEVQVVAALLDNPTVRLGANYCRKLYNRFPDEPEVTERLLTVPDLPAEIRIIHAHRSARAIRQAMDERGWLADNDSDDIVADSEDRTLCAILMSVGESDLERLIPFMTQRGLLTQSVVLRAGIAGHLPVFERALAYLAAMPLGRVRAITARPSGFAIRGLLRAAGLSPAFHNLARAVCEVSAASTMSGKVADPDVFGRALVALVTTRYGAADAQERQRLLTLIDRVSDGRTQALARKLTGEFQRAA